MADISRITLPSGRDYYFKDAYAREQIQNIQSITGAMHYIGTTTTALTDGATTSPITIGGKSVTPSAGDVAIYNQLEFVWSDTDNKWHEFGSTGSLKALAFKDSATGTVSVSGSTSEIGFTGTPGDISANYTPSGDVSIEAKKGTGITSNYTPEGQVTGSFKGTKATIKTTYEPQGNVVISVGNGTTNYEPTGQVSSTVTLNTTEINTVDANTGTLPSLSATVEGEMLSISFSQGAFPTISQTTVATSVNSATASFSGNAVELKADFSGVSEELSTTYTPAGSLQNLNFGGTPVELDATFIGDADTARGSFTPNGRVSTPTFSGDFSVTVS